LRCSVTLGFIGLHAVQRRSYGWLGTAGFAAVIVGFVVIIAGNIGEFWAFSDQSYEGPGRNASWALFLVGDPIFAVGTVLFGIATARAKVFPGDVGMVFAVIGTCDALIPSH